MTDPVYKEISKVQAARQIKRVKKFVKKWHVPLGLGWWDIHYNFYPERITDEEFTSYKPTMKAVGSVWEVHMATAADPYYLTAAVEIFLPTLVDMSDDELEEALVHEYMHVLLSPIHGAKIAQPQEEMVATWLSRAFVGHGPAKHTLDGTDHIK